MEWDKIVMLSDESTWTKLYHMIYRLHHYVAVGQQHGAPVGKRLDGYIVV